MAATASHVEPSPALGTLQIATGPDSSSDGYLEIAPDDYGSWSSAGFGGGGDGFNPSGARGVQEVAFTSGFFLFNPAFGQRELLSQNDTWQAVFPPDTTLTRTVTSPLVASDTNDDSVNDTLNSSFSVGGGMSLSVDLTQTVSSDTPGVSVLEQTYVITNNGGSANVVFVRVLDADLVWGAADFADDEVGTSMHGAGQGPFVFQQEASDPGNTAVTISGAGGDYFGGKHGVEPEGGPPPYNFGTDVDIWDAFGIPTTWRSHIAGVGYDKNGVSGTAPDGSTAPEDGFIGLEFPVSLGSDETVTITVFHTYGANSPAGGGGAPPVPAASYQGVIVLVLSLMAASMAFLLWRRRSAA